MLERAPLAALAALSLACAGHGTLPANPTETDTRVQRLAAALDSLAPEPEESRLIARTAIERSRVLARQYGMTRPALLHNVLVNVGLKQRGLCWHWAEDLYESLDALPLRGFEIHWGTAHRGEMLREHNSVIVTARGEPFESGIVLDPWRDSGRLHWSRVPADRYPWEPREDLPASTAARPADQEAGGGGADSPARLRSSSARSSAAAGSAAAPAPRK